MSSMNEAERLKQLYCTPPHIVKALLKRERFPGTIWEPAAGQGHIVKLLLECGYRDVIASDLTDWGFRPCRIGDFLTSTFSSDSIITNPPFKAKLEFLAQAKQQARYKIAMLLPVTVEYPKGFQQHDSDEHFPLKAIYSFPQSIGWLNVKSPGGKMHFLGSCSTRLSGIGIAREDSFPAEHAAGSVTVTTLIPPQNYFPGV